MEKRILKRQGSPFFKTTNTCPM